MISIVIVNWNSGPQLQAAISSICRYHHKLVSSVIIVDNASHDNSISLVEKIRYFPFALKVIRNSENYGFGKACNQGVKHCKSDYLLFLNPDTELYADTLPKTLAYMQSPNNASVGICGVRLVDKEGNTTTSAARFPTLKVMTGKILGLDRLSPQIFPAHLMTSIELQKSRLVDQVIGAFFLIRRNVFDCCGGFDESFFVYFEEVDLSLRAKKLGYSSYFLSDVFAFHEGGGCSKQVKAMRLFYSLRSRIQYAKKHYSWLEFTILIILICLELPLRIAQGIIRLSSTDLKNTFLAYIHLAKYFIRDIK